MVTFSVKNKVKKEQTSFLFYTVARKQKKPIRLLRAEDTGSPLALLPCTPVVIVQIKTSQDI